MGTIPPWTPRSRLPGAELLGDACHARSSHPGALSTDRGRWTGEDCSEFFLGS